MKLKPINWTFALLLLGFFACEDSGQEIPLGEYETGILIMNEGAFGSNDGEVFHLNPLTGELQSDIFEAANNRPFAGLLEDLVRIDERLYLVANTGKVEIVNVADFKSLGSITDDLDQPRSLAALGNKLYISDYGPYGANFTTFNSYIAVVEGLNGGPVKKKIRVSSKPEDLFVYENYIFVAGSESGRVEIIDSETDELFKTLEVKGRPMEFFEMRGELWLYSLGEKEIYFQSFVLEDLARKTLQIIPIPDATGRIAFGNKDLIYVVSSSGFPAYEDYVSQLSLYSSSLEIEQVTGTGIYGVGYDKNNNDLILAFPNGFQGDGTLKFYRNKSTQETSLTVGRGPSGFMFMD